MDKIKHDTHISQRFNEELEEIRNQVLAMGGVVEAMIADATEALTSGDSALEGKVRTADRRVNELELSIDQQCATVMARRQPTAGDLRLLIATIKIINDLERMGDQAEKVGIIGTRLGQTAGAEWGRHALVQMCENTRRMARDALDAYARQDTAQAFAVAREDRTIDHDYEAITRQAITVMMEDPRTIRAALDVLWTARAIERIGDHAKNVAEFVVYLVEGTDIRHASIDEKEQEFRRKA